MTTTFRGPMRSGRAAAGPHDVSLVVNFTVDPTSATEIAVSPAVTLPKGAIIDFMVVDGAGTSGSSPTFLLGDTTDTNGLLNNQPSNGDHVIAGPLDALSGVDFDSTPLPRDYTLVHLGGSGTDATGGLVSISCHYHMDTITDPAAFIDPSSE